MLEMLLLGQFQLPKRHLEHRFVNQRGQITLTVRYKAIHPDFRHLLFLLFHLDHQAQTRGHPCHHHLQRLHRSFQSERQNQPRMHRSYPRAPANCHQLNNLHLRCNQALR